MFRVNSYLVLPYPLTDHLGFGSSVNWQHTVAGRGLELHSQLCEAVHPSPLEGGEDTEQLGSISGVPGSTTHNIHGHKIHYQPYASGRIQSILPLLQVLLRLGC